MADIILFGGTTEGRELAELLGQKGADALVCVATEYGEEMLSPSGSVRVQTGRLDMGQIAKLIMRESPKVIIDATHPYASEISRSLKSLCGEYKLKYIRVRRENDARQDCLYFSSMEQMIDWLNGTTGIVFSALGAKEAKALSQVKGFEERIWLRILPSEESLKAAKEAGFPAKHIICMQGPFGRELNEAMFKATGASVLLTKESGAAGGFGEKIAAAKSCGMRVAVLSRPDDVEGVTLRQIKERIEENSL